MLVCSPISFAVKFLCASSVQPLPIVNVEKEEDFVNVRENNTYFTLYNCELLKGRVRHSDAVLTPI